MHTQISGVADHFAKNDDEALEIVRNIIDYFPTTPGTKVEYDPPKYDANEIFGIISKKHCWRS